MWRRNSGVRNRFFIRNHISPVAPCDDIDIKNCEILLRIFWCMFKVCRGCPPTQTPTQKSKIDFQCRTPTKLARAWYHFKCFFKLFNLRYSDSSFIHWDRYSKNHGIQPIDGKPKKPQFLKKIPICSSKLSQWKVFQNWNKFLNWEKWKK